MHEKSFKLVWLLQPVLIAIFPIVRMFSRNPFEIPITHLFMGISILAGVAIIAFFASAVLFRDYFKGALFTNFLVLLFYMTTLVTQYGLYRLSAKSFHITAYGVRLFRVRHTLPVFVFISIFLIIKLIPKIKSTFLLQVLNWPLIGLMAISFFTSSTSQTTMGSSIKRYDKENAIFRKSFLSQVNISNNNKPDIYYIILDTYTSNDYLKDICKFDNSPFLDKLKKRGFYIADKSLSNYGRTGPSLASSLNMVHLPEYLPIPVTHMGENNNVKFFLEKLGYEYCPITGIGAKTGKPSQVKTFFEDYFSLWHVYLDTWTPLYLFLFNHDKHRRSQIKNKLLSLNKSPNIKSPKYVFAHFITPHEPHVFDGNGNKLHIPSHLSDGDKFIYGHVESTKYINREILKSIDMILKNSKTPPVIIIQGDHGREHPGVRYPDKSKIYSNQILNAYYLPDNLPDSGNKLLYPEITPVNSFRIIFNKYFGTKLPIIEEKIYAPHDDIRLVFDDGFKLLKLVSK